MCFVFNINVAYIILGILILGISENIICWTFLFGGWGLLFVIYAWHTAKSLHVHALFDIYNKCVFNWIMNVTHCMARCS